MIPSRSVAALLLAVTAVAITGCIAEDGGADGGSVASLTPEPESTVTSDSGGTASFAIITDFGNCDPGEKEVADMVAAWNPQIVATAGDNTQGTQDCAPFAQSVGDYYSSFVTGPDGPAFFPVPGNHDYENEGAGEAAYLDYFAYLGALSDDPRWYEVSVGNVNLFMVDSEVPSDTLEVQREWLQASLTDASAQTDNWNIVVFHRPPYTSGPHEPNVAMRPDAGWDYAGWGADLVVAGHQHVYEELVVDGVPYLVAGVGASGLVRPCPTDLVEESKGCAEGYGAILVTATDVGLKLDYRKPDGGVGTSLRALELNR